jgi:protein-tyrosine-phosphatase
MKGYDIDISAHRSTLITEERCAKADYVVCVSSGHKLKVMEMYPNLNGTGKLVTLARDVPDPWHMDYDTYMENVTQVEELVRDFLERNINVD